MSEYNITVSFSFPVQWMAKYAADHIVTGSKYKQTKRKNLTLLQKYFQGTLKQ